MPCNSYTTAALRRRRPPRKSLQKPQKERGFALEGGVADREPPADPVEIRTYGEAWLTSGVNVLGSWRWNNSEWYWEMPDIRAAVEYLRGL